VARPLRTFNPCTVFFVEKMVHVEGHVVDTAAILQKNCCCNAHNTALSIPADVVSVYCGANRCVLCRLIGAKQWGSRVRM